MVRPVPVAKAAAGFVVAPVSEPRRVILHWTAGTGRATELERRHYHYLTQQDGTTVSGVDIGWNLRSIPRGAPRSEYAAHTRGMNSWSVGWALCGMMGAKPGGPYGPHPITAKQVDAALDEVAAFMRAWRLPPGRGTLFTHAEAESIHGHPQPGKWDITELPWDRSVKDVGEWIRGEVRRRLVPVELREVRLPPRRLHGV